jgi:molybdopterin synthase sulfur carrier subunit
VSEATTAWHRLAFAIPTRYQFPIMSGDELRTASEKIAVTLRVFGGLRQYLGASERRMMFPATVDLLDLLERLEREDPELGRRLRDGLDRGYLNVLVNGRNARFLDGMKTPLNDQDVVAFLPPIGGG